MIFFGVLSTEQTLLSPKETVSGVLVAADIENGRSLQLCFSDETAGCGDGLVRPGFQVEGGDMGQHALTC